MSESYVPAGMQEMPPLPPELAEEGACQDYRATQSTGRDIFFPPSEINRKPNAQAMSSRDEAWKRYCQGCPVLERCFQHALKHETYGVWAGTTELDRIRIREEEKSTRDPELYEYALNRLRAGYVPIPSITCYRKGCSRAVSREGMMCRFCKGIVKRQEKAARKKGTP